MTRRRFLRLAGASAGVGVGFAVALAEEKHAGQLSAEPAADVITGVQRFRSRPDLSPPSIAISSRGHAASDDVILTDCHAGLGQQGPILLDGEGRLIWFKPLSDDGAISPRALNVRVQLYRGRPVLCWFRGTTVLAHGEGHYELYDQSYRLVKKVHAGNGYRGDLHEFLLTDEGTAVFTCYGKATGELPTPGRARRGNYFYGVVQEVDLASGEVLFQWRSDHHVGFDASYEGFPHNPRNTWDYFHINSIAIDPRDGNFVVSGRNTWAVYKLHRRAGKVLWTLGGKQSDFQLPDEARFAFQHDVTLHPGGFMTIFDNEGAPWEATQSRGLVLSLDESARRAQFVRDYFHHPPVAAAALGSVQPLADDHAFVGWGDPSYFTEYDRSGRVVLDGHLRGVVSYRAFKQPWTGRPVTKPALAVARSAHHTKLYVSWNGATEVARWRVLAGDPRNSLSELGSAARADFETVIHVPKAMAWFAVEAIDASGAVLGRSRPIR